MPNVLSRLRESTKFRRLIKRPAKNTMVLRKRDDERDPGFYYRLFAGVGKRARRAVRHPRRCAVVISYATSPTRSTLVHSARWPRAAARRSQRQHRRACVASR